MNSSDKRPALRDLRLITLDLDDTLWPVSTVLERAEARLHAWLNANCPATGAATDSAAFRQLRQEVVLAQPELRNDLVGIRLASIRLALRRAGDPEHHAEAAFGAFWAARHEIECYLDVLPALERLKSRYQLAAITNGTTDIGRTPLARFFDFVVSGSETAHYKPARAVFRLACARAGVTPQHALHAGDDIDLDVRGALAAGMHAAWVNRDLRCLRMLTPPAITVPHLEALADRLNA